MGRTPVPRCRDNSPRSLAANAERDFLEGQGFFSETYRELDVRFSNWNMGTITGKWTLVKDAPCDLCASTGPAIQVGTQRVCFECLTAFPNTPWHPTGAVRPKLATLLEHARTCSKHYAL